MSEDCLESSIEQLVPNERPRSEEIVYADETED